MKAGCVGAVILISIHLFTASLIAQGKTDVVVMNNGDRITCEIKSMDSGLLYVQLDYIDGTIGINWSKVTRIESKRLFVVKTASGSVFQGALSTNPASTGIPVKIDVAETPDKKVAIDGPNVTTITETSDKWWQRFRGDLNLGMSYTKGNQAKQYNLNASVEYPTDRWKVSASYSSTLSSATGLPTADRNQLNFGLKRLLPQKNYYYAAYAGFLQSSVQAKNLQTNLGGGLGHYFKNTSSTRFAVIGGLGWQHTDYDSSRSAVPTHNATYGFVAAEARIFKFKKINLNVDASIQPDLSEPGRVYYTINQSLYVKFFKNLSWNVSFYGNWDTRPPSGLVGSDFGTSTGLGWTFGYK